jgi:hypothetical protein
VKKVCCDNCLATRFPKIAAEWHPTKNGDITPKDVVAGSVKKYWFRCNKEHEWLASLNHRTKGRGCPYCANQRVCDDNCLATIFPKIAAEWHPTKNGTISPRDVIATSNKKYWFICNKGHEWQTHLASRTRLGCQCPYCVNLLVCNDNCLATTHPEIAAEWHPARNGDITPKNVIGGSIKQYWFKCNKGHEWRTSLNHRTNGKGCPRCCESKGEKKLIEIAEYLLNKKHIVNYERQYRNSKIKNIRELPFDVALFVKNEICVIEFHGIQHYKLVNWNGRMTKEQMLDNLSKIKCNDKIKRVLCKKHKIKYLSVRHDQFDDMQDIIVGFLNISGLI